jgi:hypothetical protein
VIQSNTLSLPHIRPTNIIKQTLETQSKNSKSGSIIQEVLKQSTNQHTNGSKLTIGAAILLGVSIMVSPFKEGSPAKIIMNTTDILLQERKRKRMPLMALAWFKASYAWILVHLCSMLVALAAWWKVSRS